MCCHEEQGWVRSGSGTTCIDYNFQHFGYSHNNIDASRKQDAEMEEEASLHSWLNILYEM
jgi:hypothetical protein